jgi:hypothetical protein
MGNKPRLREYREQEQRLPMPGRSAMVNYQPISKPRHARGLRKTPPAGYKFYSPSDASAVPYEVADRAH